MHFVQSKSFQYSIQFVTALFILIVFSTSSCTNRVVFDDVSAVNSEGWNLNDKHRFTMNIEDTAATYMYYLHIRNDESYRYSNLYLFMNSRFPNGSLTTDTIECMLADPSGKWLGKGSGYQKDHLILVNSSLKFPLKGNYVVDIWQAMRDEQLVGIQSIGIRIEKYPN